MNVPRPAPKGLPALAPPSSPSARHPEARRTLSWRSSTVSAQQRQLARPRSFGGH